jgi:hypothetical protein
MMRKISAQLSQVNDSVQAFLSHNELNIFYIDTLYQLGISILRNKNKRRDMLINNINFLFIIPKTIFCPSDNCSLI